MIAQSALTGGWARSTQLHAGTARPDMKLKAIGLEQDRSGIRTGATEEGLEVETAIAPDRRSCEN